MQPDKVYLVGASLGDPGLLTVKGAGALAEADMIAGQLDRPELRQ